MRALFTDRYELTMLAAYRQSGMAARRAVCELFLRRLPPCRPFAIAAGIERAVRALLELRFEEADLRYIASAPGLRERGPDFVEWLQGLRFTGDAWAVPEGTPLFPGEPFLRIEAPIAQAQIVETLLLSIVNFDSGIASKAARLAIAARGRPVIEFGSRRTHELAAIDAARAAYVGGCAGTSNEEAGRRYGIPVFGTLAHQFILAYGPGGEERAFRDYLAAFPEGAVLLADTYDALEGIDRAIAAAGSRLRGVRLDSGDLGFLARAARAKLDAAGLGGAKVFASGDLDEYKIRALLDGGAPIDAFGVGTELVAPSDCSTLGAIYKLVAIEGPTGRMLPVAKRSEGKATWPGAKQVYRRSEGAGRAAGDEIALAEEPARPGRPLLVRRIAGGRPVAEEPPLFSARERALAEVAALPEGLTAIPGSPESAAPPEYPVERTRALRDLFERASDPAGDPAWRSH
jgi:nicotinate phosphoribosyltransferase